MNDKLKAFIFPAVLLVLVIGIGVLAFYPLKGCIQGVKTNKELTQKQEDLKQQIDVLKADMTKKASIQIDGGKTVYENIEFKFSKDASFAPMIEKFIDISKLSGVRIHSIDYNYAPANDPVFMAQYAGYNVCEMDIMAVGRYNNFQKLFDTIVADMNIMNIAEMDIKPWESDNSILVAKLKLRIYTKTI